MNPKFGSRSLPSPLNSLLLCSGLIIAWVANVGTAQCQSPPPEDPSSRPTPAPSDGSSSADPATIFPQSVSNRSWIVGQPKIVFQWHPPYAGFLERVRADPDAGSGPTNDTTSSPGLETMTIPATQAAPGATENGG